MVHGLGYLIRKINAEDRLLIVDDVYDSGLSVKAVLDTLSARARKNTPNDIRIATPWFKPGNNKSGRIPDYYLHETERWLVFPHELDGVSKEELIENKPGIESIFSSINH
jgi:hypoxanthine phosphoribosyltransferase